MDKVSIWTAFQLNKWAKFFIPAFIAKSGRHQAGIFAV